MSKIKYNLKLNISKYLAPILEAKHSKIILDTKFKNFHGFKVIKSNKKWIKILKNFGWSKIIILIFLKFLNY